MFLAYPNYSVYRTLKLNPNWMRGEDVFALQTALEELGSKPGSTDGVLGIKTSEAISRAQKSLGITVDGLAGGGTQQAICKRLANMAAEEHSLPQGLVFGHIMHESSCRVGNYSPQRDDGSYDAGPCQRNSAIYDVEESFIVPLVINFLGNNDRQYYNKFFGVKDVARRWALATGSWNAPAYAGWIANEEGAKVPRRDTAEPGPTARRKLEEYMASASAYLQVRG